MQKAFSNLLFERKGWKTRASFRHILLQLVSKGVRTHKYTTEVSLLFHVTLILLCVLLKIVEEVCVCVFVSVHRRRTGNTREVYRVVLNKFVSSRNPEADEHEEN